MRYNQYDIVLVNLDQIKTIDKQRIIKYLDKLKSSDIQKLKSIIYEMLVE